MKRYLYLFFLAFLLPNLVLASEATLSLGSQITIESYNVLLKNIKADKAVISVNDQSAIFSLNQEKTIGGANIKLLEINFFSESEGNVKIDFSPLYVCGNQKCDPNEDKESCCKDCPCSSGYDCEENKCLVHVDNECTSDSDCNDNNADTLDKCTQGRPRKCSNISTVICDMDSDCDDSNECTQDKCISNDCKNTKIEGCISEEENEQNIPQEDIENQQQAENPQEDNQLEQNQVPKKESFLSKILNFIKRIFS